MGAYDRGLESQRRQGRVTSGSLERHGQIHTAPPGWIPGATFYLLVRVVIMKTTVLLIITLIAIMWGCSSVISNSEGFYKDRPRRPINWREYMTD
jgi:hypothetical protein